MISPAPIDARTALQARAYPWTSWRELEPSWRDLFRDSPVRSFFLSPDWVGTWLSVFGPQLKPEIVVLNDNDRPVGCCLLVFRTEMVRFIPVRRVYLNASGEDEADETYIEFNGLLTVRGYEAQVAQAICAHLKERAWDELMLNGCVPSEAIDALVSAHSGLTVTSRVDRSYYLSLSHVRSEGSPFEQRLSKNARQNLKRTANAYRELGPFRLEVAANTEEALEMLDQLAQLHQQHWRSRNQAGVFNSPRFTKFSRELTRRLHPEGCVHLMRLSAGDKVVGVIYNLALDGKVYAFYLSGFNYGGNNNLRPGLMTVFHAIQHCLERDFAEFDMMAGDVQYKRTFAEQFRELHWIVIQRPSLKLRLLAALRSLKQAYRQRTEKKEDAAPGRAAD